MNKKLQKFKNDKGGFTLIELIVVIAIIGILAAIMLPKFASFTDGAKKAGAKSDAKNIYTAITALHTDPDTTTATIDTAAVLKYLGSTKFKGTLGTIAASAEGDAEMFKYSGYKNNASDTVSFTAKCTGNGTITVEKDGDATPVVKP